MLAYTKYNDPLDGFTFSNKVVTLTVRCDIYRYTVITWSAHMMHSLRLLSFNNCSVGRMLCLITVQGPALHGNQCVNSITKVTKGEMNIWIYITMVTKSILKNFQYFKYKVSTKLIMYQHKFWTQYQASIPIPWVLIMNKSLLHLTCTKRY